MTAWAYVADIAAGVGGLASLKAVPRTQRLEGWRRPAQPPDAEITSALGQLAEQGQPTPSASGRAGSAEVERFR
jgi:hypothetical protein